VEKERRFVLGANVKKIVVERDLLTSSQRHCHRYIEIVYFYKGNGKHEIGGETIDIKAGDLFIIPVGVYHTFSGIRLEKVNIMVNPEYLCPDIPTENFLEQFGKKYLGEEFSLDDNNYVRFNDFSRERNESIIFNILQEYNLQLIGCDEVIKCEVKSLLVSILRKKMEKGGSGNIQFAHKITIEKAIMYIDEHFSEISRAEEVAQHVGYNAVYFNRIFVQNRGVSISYYVRKKKIEYACRLLSNTNYTIERICEIIGYSDLKNFYKSFKKIMNFTPTEYRNVGQNKN